MASRTPPATGNRAETLPTPASKKDTSHETHLPAALTALTALLTAAPMAHAQDPILTGTTLDFVGVTPTHVSYSATAPESNYGAPTTASDAVPYDIYLKSDAKYVYGLWQITPGGTGSVGQFVNIYVSTFLPVNSSNLGFEINNNDAFKPGTSGNPQLPSGDLFINSNPATGTDEFAIPWSFFTTDPLNLGYTPISATNNVLQFRLSQAFGYSVAGGSDYGANRLGVVTFTPAPEPSPLAVLALGALGLGALALQAYKRQHSAAS